MSDRKKPTIKECILLYLAHWILRRGKWEHDPERLRKDGPEKEITVTVTPWQIEVKANSHSTNRYAKRGMGTTFSRRWRELREDDRLSDFGVQVTERVPTEDDRTAGTQKVWDLTVDVDRFFEALEQEEPFTEFEV